MAYDRGLADHVRAVLADEAGVVEKPMFGGLSFLVEGRIAVAVSGDGGLLVRPAPDQLPALLRERHTETPAMGRRHMRGWLRVRLEGLSGDQELARWVDMGVAHARTLPRNS